MIKMAPKHQKFVVKYDKQNTKIKKPPTSMTKIQAFKIGHHFL